MIAATVLSAGASSRMGFPKALLEYHGVTFLQSILDAAGAVGMHPRIVILGHGADKILAKHDLRDVVVLATEGFEAGPIGSIRAAIRAVEPHPVEGILVWPVDMPHVAIATVEALLAGFRASGRPIVIPAYQKKHGHPVIFGREVFGELLEAPDSEGARAVVHADPGRVLEVPVDDSAVLEDLNTPVEYQDLMKKEDVIRS
ncbi:MAG: nucleotidyltransferase family protein [Gemmatimonadetes bacterium]|nr:nucleotidyltransferase family protein [Gemmatimonadota bacterium]